MVVGVVLFLYSYVRGLLSSVVVINLRRPNFIIFSLPRRYFRCTTLNRRVDLICFSVMVLFVNTNLPRN